MRALAYRTLCAYRIARGAKIGFMAYIDAKETRIGANVRLDRFCRFIAIERLVLKDNVEIGRGCQFRYLRELVLGEGTRLQAFSTFMGAPWDRDGYVGSFKVGQSSLICGHMHFDLSRDIEIGNHVTIAGLRSSFWTHGLSWDKCQPIVIADHCFIGSTVLFGPGTEIAENCVVGMGSVVQGKFQEPDCLILGNRAQVVKRSYRGGHKSE